MPTKTISLVCLVDPCKVSNGRVGRVTSTERFFCFSFLGGGSSG